MSDNRTTELLPCPFCGGEAEFQIFGNICNVVCAECHIGTRFESIDFYEQTIAAWNTRAERTCRQEEGGWSTEGDHARVWLTCGHDCMVPTVQDLPTFCPICGARVEVDE